MVTYLMVVLTQATWGSTGTFIRDYDCSVFGSFGPIRSLLCSEAVFAYVYPNYRDGLGIPIAKAIEAKGGTIWRGQRAEQVIVEEGRAKGVVMADGREARAPIVALACGTDRAWSFFDEVPPEIEVPLRHSQNLAHQDFHVFAVLDKPVVPAERNRWLGVIEPNGTMPQWLGPPHSLVPWTTEPGKQFIVAGRAIPVSELGEHGSQQSIFAGMHDINDGLFPGYKEAG